MPSRRHILIALASTASAAALAGCNGRGDDPEPTPTPGGNETDSPDNDTPVTPADGEVDPDELTATTERVVRQLARGEFEAILADHELTDTVAAQLDADGLASAWNGQTGSLGQFVEVVTVEYGMGGGYHVTDAVVRFTGGRQVVRVAYTDDAAIAGLRFLGSGGSYSPPAYADESAFAELDRSVPATADCSLPATLSMPTGEESVPGVVLVHGSGPSDMDGTLGPNKPLRDLAGGLASRGVAVLRYDKRTAVCDVDLASLTLDEKVTDDALAALDVLRNHERVDAGNTVVVGHSIGGMVVPRILERDETLAGGAMLAAPTRSLPDLILAQTEYLVSRDGTVTDEEAAVLERREAAVERIRSTDVADGEVVLDLGGRPFWRTVGEYDQVETAKTLDDPLFVLQGERDYQVTVADDFEGWQDALSGRENVQLQSYEDLNHLFLPGTGQPSPEEYGQSGNVAEPVVADLAAWIGDVTEG